MNQKEFLKALGRDGPRWRAAMPPVTGRAMPTLNAGLLGDAFVNFMTGAATSNCGTTLIPGRTKEEFLWRSRLASD
jgi:hypothetical protein